MNSQYEQLKNEINEVRNTSTSEERIQELWSGIEGAKRARERENARRAAWLKEREERRARAERTWRPQTTSPAASPAPPSSPLLTSLLKSSPVVTTPQHIPHPASLVEESPPRVPAIETTMCHMCNVKVPKRFLKQHKEGSKHKTLVKIANIALERISKHINDEHDCDETEHDTSEYFCSHCTAIVKISERKSHEDSDTHKSSVYLDKSLSNFLDLYSTLGNDNHDDDDMDSYTLEASSSSQNNDKFDLMNYFDILKNKYNMSMKFKILDEEKLEFEIDGKKVELDVQNFLGLKTGSNDSVECVVCKEVVNDKIEHIMQVKHMHRVSISFEDIHCKREIYPSWHHCVLCNVITDGSNSHTTSDPDHQKLLQEALKHSSPDNSTENLISPESSTYMTNETIKTEAEASNQESNLNQYSDLLETDNNSMVSKKNIKSNVIKTFCRHCNVYIVTKNWRKHASTIRHLSNMTSKYYYLFKIDLDITSCKICDVVVHVDDFERHVDLSEHKNKYDALLATHKVRKIDNNQFFCGICDKLLLVKNEVCHVKAKEHVEYLASHGHSSPTTSEYHCSVCDVRVPNTIEDIQSHNEGSSHNAKELTNAINTLSLRSTSSFENYTMLETQFPDLVNCVVCDILIPKDSEHIQNHLETENHLKLYEKLLKDHQLVLNNDNIYCNICKVFVGLKSEMIHLKGKKHLKNLRKAKENPNIPLSAAYNAKLEALAKVKASGLIFNVDDLNLIIKEYDISDNLKKLVCKTCKVTVLFTNYNSIGHLKGSKHKQKLFDVEIMNSERRRYYSSSSSSSYSDGFYNSTSYPSITWQEFYQTLASTC